MINYRSIRVPKSSCSHAATILGALVSLTLVSRIFSAGLSFAGAPLTPGTTARVSVPLSELEKAYVAEGGNAVPPYTVATLAVPRGFDPKKAWPVLIVFSSSEHQHPNWYDLMVFYRVPALAQGWVVLAGDGPESPSRVDSSGWRAGHTLAALDALHRSFPASKRWPLACAGQSGGAKRASYLAPMFAVAGDRMAGIFLTGINEERISDGCRHFKPPLSFFSIPIFLSSGDQDRIATHTQQLAVENSMRRTGFKNIRHKTFPGGHTMFYPHLREALEWFQKGP